MSRFIWIRGGLATACLVGIAVSIAAAVDVPNARCINGEGNGCMAGHPDINGACIFKLPDQCTGSNNDRCWETNPRPGTYCLASLVKNAICKQAVPTPCGKKGQQACRRREAPPGSGNFVCEEDFNAQLILYDPQRDCETLACVP